jgi:hypothetical protein
MPSASVVALAEQPVVGINVIELEKLSTPGRILGFIAAGR